MFYPVLVQLLKMENITFSPNSFTFLCNWVFHVTQSDLDQLCPKVWFSEQTTCAGLVALYIQQGNWSTTQLTNFISVMVHGGPAFSLLSLEQLNKSPAALK